jgi:hypothetical protein
MAKTSLTLYNIRMEIARTFQAAGNVGKINPVYDYI